MCPLPHPNANLRDNSSRTVYVRALSRSTCRRRVMLPFFLSVSSSLATQKPGSPDCPAQSCNCLPSLSFLFVLGLAVPILPPLPLPLSALAPTYPSASSLISSSTSFIPLPSPFLAFTVPTTTPTQALPLRCRLTCLWCFGPARPPSGQSCAPTSTSTTACSHPARHSAPVA